MFVMASFGATKTILLALGTDREIAQLAHWYAMLSIPGVLPNLWYYGIRQYFQAQGIVKPALVSNAFFVVVNLVLNLVLVSQFGFVGKRCYVLNVSR
jgi:Na+-driven multidrug efflux pump